MRKDTLRGRALEKWVAVRYRLRRRGGSLPGCDLVELPGERVYPLGIECKAYSVLQLRTGWVTQARKNAKKEGRMFWAIFQRPKGWRRPVVTIDESFFRMLWNLYLEYELGLELVNGNQTEGALDGDHEPGA